MRDTRRAEDQPVFGNQLYMHTHKHTYKNSLGIKEEEKEVPFVMRDTKKAKDKPAYGNSAKGAQMGNQELIGLIYNHEVYMHVCVYVCMCICMYVCMYGAPMGNQELIGSIYNHEVRMHV
jgi:hypothetical protein